MSGAAGLLLFGGAFDPPHLGHRRILAAALDALPVGGGLVLPTGRHPHKGTVATPDTARLELCRIAFGDLPGVMVSDLDLCHDRPAYTIDTVRTLRELYPSQPFFWVIGSDNLHGLGTWRDPHGLLELVTLVTAPRQGFPATREVLSAQGLSPEETESILDSVLDLAPDAISATAIRAALAKGQPPAELDPRVTERIQTLGLYRSGGDRD